MIRQFSFDVFDGNIVDTVRMQKLLRRLSARPTCR